MLALVCVLEFGPYIESYSYLSSSILQVRRL